MTEEEIREMLAGPETDALLGRLFPHLVEGGWGTLIRKGDSREESGPPPNKEWSLEEAETKAREWEELDKKGWYSGCTRIAVPWVWNPSENVAEAWEVLEAMSLKVLKVYEGHVGVNVIVGRSEAGNPTCSYQVTVMRKMYNAYHVNAETAPLAICRAVLLAMREYLR